MGRPLTGGPSIPTGLPHDITADEARVLNSVLTAVRQVRFGYVQVVLQDGQVVQIERLEKERVVRRGTPSPR